MLCPMLWLRQAFGGAAMKLTTEQLEAMFTWLSARHYAELRAQREGTSTDSESRHILFLELLASLEKELYDRRRQKPAEPDPNIHPVHQQRKPAGCPACRMYREPLMGERGGKCEVCGREVAYS